MEPYYSSANVSSIRGILKISRLFFSCYVPQDRKVQIPYSIGRTTRSLLSLGRPLLFRRQSCDIVESDIYKTRPGSLAALPGHSGQFNVQQPRLA